MDEGRGKVITWVFTGVLCLAFVVSLFLPAKAFSESENRYLKQKPEFTIEGLLDGSYADAYDGYLSDQFPGRNRWIGIKVMAERIQGKQDVNGVYFGKDDYLIEKFDTEQVVGEQLGKNLERLLGFVGNAQSSLGKDHVKVMMVPTASQVLKEKLPWLASPYDQSGVSDYLSRELGEELVIPVEEILGQHAGEAIFYKTDHHWTGLGAYYGYQAWATSMGFEPWPQEAFEISTVTEEFLGTVYSKVNVPHKPDSIQLYLPKEPVDYEIYYDGGKMPSGMYQEKALEGKDKYAVYLDGNHGLTQVYTKDDRADPDRKLLIIKDSFANSFAPFAVNHAAETYLIDLRYYNGDVEGFMEENGITDVLVLYQIPGFAKEKTVTKLWR